MISIDSLIDNDLCFHIVDNVNVEMNNSCMSARYNGLDEVLYERPYIIALVWSHC